MDVLWGIGGMAALIALALLLSTNRRAVRWRTVLAALGIQVLFGILVLYWSWGQRALEQVSQGVQAVINSSNAGIQFVFGPVLPQGEDAGVVFAFQVLPVIIFFASLTAVLYHFKILQFVVEKLGAALGAALGTRKAESVNAAANIFVGQTEAPLVIRPYLKGLTRSGLFAVMVGGLSTVAGSVLVGYSLLGAPLEYLIAASFMAAPGALMMAKLVLPEDDDKGEDTSEGRTRPATPRSPTRGPEEDPEAAERQDRPVSDVPADPEGDKDGDGIPNDEDDLEGMEYRNVIDAAASGAADGLKLALNIGAMLLAFISLIALVNLLIGTVGGWFGQPDLTFEQILGYAFAPLMTVIGVPWGEATTAGSFVGQKVIVNEFVAFSNFAPIIDQLSPKTAAIVTFALTGFANLGSLGILLGGLGSLVKDRRREIAELGIRAILAATLANLMSAAIAGILIG
ncbi:nucleoside transporter [Serinicoccus sp. CNJ-927]|uniref:NupC/NupG family nucleoside CNT transporter n=1 Tax=Serinicoccus sp. CNJ-927 TaxID=1904970 RepID=UPI0009599E6A|nr:nucleoside transporter C-terminal domain-containing protein [Serinicoccus sp. CNJ-927]OLT41812.1 nucleoside transporter [Serinicoccus sp. CNJ-927]